MTTLLFSCLFGLLWVVNGSICLSQFPTAIPNNYFPSEFAEMLASHLFLFLTAPRCPSAKIQNIWAIKFCLVIKDTQKKQKTTSNKVKNDNYSFLLNLVLICWTQCFYKYYNLYKLIVVSCNRKPIIDVNAPERSLNTNVSWSSILVMLAFLNFCCYLNNLSLTLSIL